MTKQEKYLYDEIVDRHHEILRLQEELVAVKTELIEANKQLEINKLIQEAREKFLPEQ
jgi:hypothetical protein|tara:strand:- start:382 stop:555 length:174 start_codon:yes stop_codon:yes gene_type:complete